MPKPGTLEHFADEVIDEAFPRPRSPNKKYLAQRAELREELIGNLIDWIEAEARRIKRRGGAELRPGTLQRCREYLNEMTAILSNAYPAVARKLRLVSGGRRPIRWR